MKGILKQGVISLVGLLLSGAPASGAVLGTSARQMGSGEIETVLFYQGVSKQDLLFSVGGSGACQGNAPSGPNPTFACGSTGDFEGEGSGEALISKIVFQPYENLQYFIWAGAGKYAVDIGTFTLAGDNPGFLGGIGVRGVVMPDTIVSPAVAVEFGLSWQRYEFDRIEGSLSGDRSRLDMAQVQMSVEGSHRFKLSDERLSLEPYGGVKWLRTRLWHKDFTTGDRTGGRKDTVHPFVGMRLPIFKKEAFFVEASFVNGMEYAAGLSVRFGENS